MNDISSILKNLAKKNNIDAIGVVNSSQLNLFSHFFISLAKDTIPFYKRDYSYKTDIRKAWTKAVSVISFAVSYNTPAPCEPIDITKRGKIARAGWGNDYHTVLKQRAEALMRDFGELYPCEYRIYVDTGYLSDRALAYCAGIGYYGKNNFLIVPGLGSFVFLGHIICDIKLDENKEFLKSNCNNCCACIKVCPQKANCGQTLDYGSCISYITQSGIKGDTYGYIYGCDICQNVCPVNEKSTVKYDSDFMSDSEKVYPLLNEIITEGRECFEEKYANSAMLWVGYERIKQNALNIINLRENNNSVY